MQINNLRYADPTNVNIIMGVTLDEETTNRYHAAGGEALYVKIKCNGKPFYAWPSIPPGQVIACGFNNAPIGTTDLATNAQLIADITATSEQVLTYV